MHKLLVIDDSPTLRGIIVRTLLHTDLAIDEILEAGSGSVGLTQLELNPDVRLVLCDVDMPAMDAVGFVQAVLRTYGDKRPALVVVTTESRRATAQAALTEGADAFIEKPFTPERLQAVLTPLLSDAPSGARIA